MIVADPSDLLAAAIDAEDWLVVANTLADSREPGDQWLRTFARNADALRTHRPDVYAYLRGALNDEALLLGDAGARAANADDVNLLVFNAIELLRKNARSFAIGGIRDGALVAAMAKFAPELILGRMQHVLVLEPDLGRLVAGLGCTDLTGPRGPIEQRNFDWYVGAGWDERLFADLAAEPTRIPPLRTIAATEPRPEIDAAMAEIERRWDELNEQRKSDVARYYAGLADDELLAVLGSHPPRRPRMLLITSLYTTVLQYSTYDSADAMRQLGWDVKVLVEPSMWTLVAKPAITAAIAEFQPDVVFQIDHLRYELGDDIVPPNLPYVCWIQDHFANLTCDAAGRSVGERDFVLAGATYRYVERYGYPRAQCIDMPKVSRMPTDAVCLDRTGSKHGGVDLIYVSHWSQSPEAIVLEICQRTRDIADATSESIMRECGAELTRIYANGGNIRLHAQMRDLVRGVMHRRGLSVSTEMEYFFIETLFVRLNNAFYRQQGLLWASQIADELGLTLGIYGKGWSQHDQLARHARGAVKYGPDLEQLTRQSTILLQLEPYACYSHQRMLDALLAGGFSLVRSHEYNTVPLKVRDFLKRHVPPDVYSTEAAYDCLPDDTTRAEFDAILAEAAPLRAMGDIVDVVRGWQRAGTIGDEVEALPGISQIEFDTLDQMRDRVRRFTTDPAARRSIADAQRNRVEKRLTYVASLRMAMRELHDRLQHSIASSRSLELPSPMSEAA